MDMLWNNLGRLSKRAIALWTRALNANPELVAALRDRGLTYHKIRKYKKAVDDFSTALTKTPSNAELYRIRGDAYYRLKKLDNALEDYNKSIESNSLIWVAIQWM